MPKIPSALSEALAVLLLGKSTWFCVVTVEIRRNCFRFAHPAEATWRLGGLEAWRLAGLEVRF
jgi:hypothetical protein